MVQKIIKIGNSVGVLIPRELLQQTGLVPGSKVYLEKDPNGTSIVINKNAQVFSSSITPDFLRIINNINKKYGVALKNLANKNHE